MKKRKRHTGKIPKKRNEVLVALPIIIILAFVCGSRFGNAVGRTAVIGAGLMLPEGAVLSAKSSAVRSIEKKRFRAKLTAKRRNFIAERKKRAERKRRRKHSYCSSRYS